MKGADGPARRWLLYLQERSPVVMLLLVAVGQSLSASYLVRGTLDVAGVAVSAAGIIALLVLMRLMDELKDVAKDRVAHPERPLPRGLLMVEEVRRAILLLGVSLIGLAIVIGLLRSPVAGGLYALTTAYAFLMYREFFASRLLGANAFLYAITHQVIVIPIYLFAVACIAPEDAFSADAIWFGLTGLGASIVLEVSRKLDPLANPILGTYLVLHGRGITLSAIIAGLALLAVSTYQIEVHPLVWPFIGVMAAALPLVYVAPGRFRVVEGAAALLALVQMLAPALRHGWRTMT